LTSSPPFVVGKSARWPIAEIADLILFRLAAMAFSAASGVGKDGIAYESTRELVRPLSDA